MRGQGTDGSVLQGSAVPAGSDVEAAGRLNQGLHERAGTSREKGESRVARTKDKTEDAVQGNVNSIVLSRMVGMAFCG